MRRLAVLAAALTALAVPAAAQASEAHPTLAELENEVMCPTCHTTLAMSQSPAANRIRAFIRREIAAHKTKSEIKDALVAQFGDSILASPPARGFNLLVWLLPLVGGLVAIVVLGWLARRWLESRGPPVAAEAAGATPLDAGLDRRVDEELARFDG